MLPARLWHVKRTTINKTFVLSRKTFTIAKKKVNVFGKSALDIHSLVKHATKAVYLSVCVDCENLAICRTKGYNRLVRLKNTLHKSKKSEEILTVMHGSIDWRKISASRRRRREGWILAIHVRLFHPDGFQLHHLRNYKIMSPQTSLQTLEFFESDSFWTLIPSQNSNACVCSIKAPKLGPKSLRWYRY